MMKRYEIYKDHFETKYNGKSMTADEVIDAYMDATSLEPELVGQYSTKEEAMTEWEKYNSLVDTRIVDGNNGKLLVGEIVYLEEVECNEEGEPLFGDWLEYNAEGFETVDDVIAELKEKNGSFEDGIDEYVLLQQAYIEGPAEEPYFTALAINWGDVREGGLYPVYEVTWNPYFEWLAGDREDEGDACDWENPIKIEKQTSGWDPEDGILY